MGTAEGVFRAGQVRRVSEDVRWSREAVENVKGCPHEPVPGRGRQVPTFVRLELRGNDPIPKLPTTGFTEPEAPKRQVRPLYVRKEDIITHGPTAQCPGCLTVMQQMPYNKPHTEECRARFAEILGRTEAGQQRVQRSENRMQDAIIRESEKIMTQAEAKREEWMAMTGHRWRRMQAAAAVEQLETRSAQSTSAYLHLHVAMTRMGRMAKTKWMMQFQTMQA